MKFECEKCQREATVHLTEIINGQKIERHLCQECAGTEGITIKAQMPISKIIEELMLQSSAEKEFSDLRCDVCGISFLEFRRDGLLGCPHDYEVFEHVLVGLLERSHQGRSCHVGKIPANAAESERVQNELLRLRGSLAEAVGREDYEEAAALRDRVRQLSDRLHEEGR
ncbi:MAG: UvrB/UvrC motif-containing protein [Phycisphaerae bacterium]|nr:UvrB/UvrC motif-containing protein [Phycisphaerae bacterium]